MPKWLVPMGAAPVALAPITAWAQRSPAAEGYPYGPHMMPWGGGWFPMVFGPVFMILALAVAIAIAAWLVRAVGGPWLGTHRETPRSRTPLDILKERFARGDIDKEEFEARRRVLGE